MLFLISDKLNNFLLAYRSGFPETSSSIKSPFFPRNTTPYLRQKKNKKQKRIDKTALEKCRDPVKNLNPLKNRYSPL